MSGLLVNFVLTVTDHVFRRYALPLVLLVASLLRYNVFSLVYLALFLVGVVIPGPRLKSKRVCCVVYLISILIFSVLFILAQVFFQISLATGPSLGYCDTLQVILQQIGLIQYTAPVSDIVRYLLLDVLVLIISSVCVGVAVSVSTLRPETESLDESTSSSGDLPITQQPAAAAADSGLTELSTLALPSDDALSAQSYLKLPQYLLVVMDVLIFFLFWLSGVAVPSLTSFWYFAVFLSLSLMWSIHFTHIQYISRILRFVSLIYSAIHILVLYLYQFQSFQLDAPSNGSSHPSLVVRLFGLTPLVKTVCSSPTTLSFWPDTPTSYIVNPWSLLVLYWILGTDCQLWLSTPKPFWSLYHTYCIHKVSSPTDELQITERGHSNVQHYGSTDKRQTSTEPEEEEDGAINTSADSAARHRYLSKHYVAFIHYKQMFIQRAIELWDLLMSVNYVFSIVAMMVWSVLYPSWPALILLLWALVIWVIPRITPKQSLYYSSPLLVLYAVCLLLLTYLNALPVTHEGFIWGYSVGIECKYSSAHTQDCLSQVLGGKCLLALLFFASLRELIKEMRERRERNRQDPDSTTSILYSELYLILTTYWIVAVLGAFLLVILVGDPSALKSIYLLSLFIFLLFYQLFCKWWMYVSYPLWWVLMLYAALHLVMVYTFQFDDIHDLWHKAYNHSSFHGNATANDVFRSIGFELGGTNRSNALFNLLVPPAVFIAVIALQVRYFTPHHLPSNAPQQQQQQTPQRMVTISQVLSSLTRAVTLSEIQFDDIEQELTRKEEEQQRRRRERLRSANAGLEEMNLAEMSVEEAQDDEEVIREDSASVTFYRLLVYTLIKLRQTIVFLWHLFWRFSEIHTSKLIIVAMFAYGLYEPSATYFSVVICAVVIAPLPFLNPIVYPLLTIYLGVLSLGKFLFQLPVVPVVTVKEECNTSTISNISDIPGTVYTYSFSPQSSDSSWIGLNQTNDSAQYVGLLICVSLLICFWYSSRRHQMHFYSSNDIVIKPWEFKSLFLGRESAQFIHQSATDTSKFLVNHFFDLFGVEMCFIFEAVLIATRIDVYGICYAVILGLMLITPRTLLPPVWIIFLVLHGLSLIVQYMFLVGLPPSLLCHLDGYPWDSVFPGYIGQIERWLYIPHTGSDTLDKYLLYADLFTYLMICLQMRNFILNPLSVLRNNNMFPPSPDIYGTKYWFDSIKVLVFQYSFWVALFVLFAASATRLSLFGLLYLLLCFVFLYRGQNLLTDSRNSRVKWWSILRMFMWSVLLLRSILQLVSCVFVDSITSEHTHKYCWAISLFNVRCVRNSYYGIAKSQECSNGSESTIGLWLDMIVFAFITVEIIILDTQYAEQVRNKIIRKEEDAQNFAKVRNKLMEEKKETARLKEKEELRELKERAEHLKLTEGRVDHFLYAGVRVPPDYLSTAKEKTGGVQIKAPSDLPLEEEEEESQKTTETKEEESESSTGDKGMGLLRKGLLFLYSLWLNAVDIVIEWLESNSADYRLVVYRLKRARYQSGKDVLLATIPPVEGEMTTPTSSQGSSSMIAAVTLDDNQPKMETGEVRHSPKKTKKSPSLPDDVDEPEVVSKHHPEASQAKHIKLSSGGAEGSPHFDKAGDTLINILKPSEYDEQRAQELEAKLSDFTRKYSERPKRFLYALYYWCLFHFEYVVFLFVIISIVSTGALTSFVYAGLLFLWGLLSLPLPTKRFWLGLIFYTMLVMIMKYIYSFFLRSVFNENLSDQLNNPLLGNRIDLDGVLAWIFGVQTDETYFVNGVVNLLLLMVLMFHRGLLKQYGLWTHTPLFKKRPRNIFKTFYKSVKYFFKQLLASTSVAGRKDFYIGMLTCDVLCFLTIVFGYSYFSVTTSTSSDIAQVANYIQSSTIPVPFLIMLFLQFMSMLVDRAIYIRHSVMAKLIYYIFLLVGWHVWLLIVVPIITYRTFIDNPAAQLIYFFKSGYFVLSALQIISGYPTRLLGYFVGSSYSTISGLLFIGYRLIPVLPELREVVDWMFTDTTLSLIHWLRVQELWAQVYQVKVRRMREASTPRDLGEKQGTVSKLLLGGGLVVVLVMLIWGPLVVMSLINQASISNPPSSASVSLTLEGSQLLKIQAQNPFVYTLTSNQYGALSGRVTSESIRREFQSLFRSEDFRRIVFPGNSSVLWTASPTTKEQLRTLLLLNTNASMTFSWSIFRLQGGTADETVTGSYKTNITGETINRFIENLNPDSGNKSSISLKELYPILIYAPKNGDSTEFRQLSQYIPGSKFNCTADLNTTNAYTLKSDNISDGAEETIINQWWTLKPADNRSFLPNSGQEPENGLEMIVYSERVSPSILSFVANLGVIGLYISVVLVIGRFIRGYVSALPQNLLIDQIAEPDPLLKLCDDIFTVREMKILVLEEILVGKLYFIFRSPERLIALTDEKQKEKTD